MSIRNLLITLLTLMGLLILVGSSWEIREIRAKQSAAQWVHQSNQVADLSLRASGVMAMERGITAAILSDPDRANPEMLYEMAEQRRSGDELYGTIVALASELTDADADLPLSRSLRQLEHHRNELASARQQVDQLIAGDAPALNEQQWIRLATRHIETLSDLRDATNQSKPGNLYSHTPNPVIKEVLFNASEHAGRERAIVGAAIAQSRSLSEAELARLERYRDIVDISLERTNTLLKQLPDIPEMSAAREALDAGFLGTTRRCARQCMRPAMKASPTRSAPASGTRTPLAESAPYWCSPRRSASTLNPAWNGCGTTPGSHGQWWPYRFSPPSASSCSPSGRFAGASCTLCASSRGR